MDFVWIVLLITAGLLVVIGLAWLLDWALFDDLKTSRLDSAKPSQPSRPADEANEPSRLSRLGELRELIEANKKTGPLGKETLRTVTVPTQAAEQTLELPTLNELSEEEIMKKAHPHRENSEIGEVTLKFEDGTEKTRQAVIFEDLDHRAVFAHVEPGDYKNLVGLTSSQGDFSRVKSVKANPLSVSGAVCIRASKGVGVPGNDLPEHEHELPEHEHDLPEHEHELPEHEHDLPEHEHELPEHEHEHDHDEFSQLQNEIDDIKLQVESILEPVTDDFTYEFKGENQYVSFAGGFSVFTEQNKVAAFLIHEQDIELKTVSSIGKGDIFEFNFAESDHQKPDSPTVHTWVVDRVGEEGSLFRVYVGNKAKNPFELDETYQLKIVHREAKEYDHSDYIQKEADNSTYKDWLLRANGNKKNPADFAPYHDHPYAEHNHTHTDVPSHNHDYASSTHSHSYASTGHEHDYATSNHAHSVIFRSGTSTNPSLSKGEPFLNTSYKVIYIGT